jgi:hypothetical protein
MACPSSVQNGDEDVTHGTRSSRPSGGREADLTAAVEDEQIDGPTPAELAEIKAMLTEGLRDGPIPQRKAILQKFVSEVRVQSRKAIYPVFRLPLCGLSHNRADLPDCKRIPAAGPACSV